MARYGALLSDGVYLLVGLGFQVYAVWVHLEKLAQVVPAQLSRISKTEKHRCNTTPAAHSHLVQTPRSLLFYQVKRVEELT